MINQMEKNKGMLLEEMEKLASRPLDRAAAERLALYKDAYKALCLVGEEGQRHVAGTALPPFTKETAKEWTDGMVNEDGSRGPHWTIEKAEQVMAQRVIDCDPYTFWAILNSIYSDYCAVFKKFNINNMDVYADLAKAWIDDSDAVKDKAAAYYNFVVKH